MKRKKIYSAAIGLFTVLTVHSQQELPASVSAEWFAQRTENIKSMEYEFASTSVDGSTKAMNRANRLAFTVQPTGYSVYSIQQETGEKKWQTDFIIKGIGRQKIQSTKENFVTVHKRNSLSYQSPAYDVEYINDASGMRQNFIIKKKPAAKGLLTAILQINTTLTVKEMGHDKFIFYPNGESKDIQLIYDGLQVWDATNTKLPASMRLDESSKQIFIEVNDDNAVYPVTIDPLNRTPEWTTSADGVLPGLLTNLQLQVQTTYGYTVAGLGDINGDGFDDVAISAPTMADVITGTGSLTGVGAVFIYLGSPTGLSSTPAKVLQPTTALDGALFGFSVDAGDITGDGKNDIIIGAPLDRYQTTASGLLGPTNVTVKAGKVYIYRSEDLFAAANPTPFLQLRLQGTNFFSTGIVGLLGSNVTVNPLFGFSVAVTKDLNGDNKADILIGSPTYLGVDILSVQSGAAFVFYSNNLATTSPMQLETPDPSLLGLSSLPLANTSGLLFGFSIDGAGDYNNDGNPDVVVGAPAGVDLSSLGGIFSGQVLGGSAYVYYGSGTGVDPKSEVKLQASPSGLLSNAANLFGYKVKGAEDAFGNRTGAILIGSPNNSVVSNVLNGLRVKAGEVHVFKKQITGASGTFTSDQALSSPRSSSILSILSGQTINVSLLFGASIDNMLDVNCDNIGDIIVGEPLSTAVPLLGADVVGGAAYIYLGKADGTYVATPFWDLFTNVSPLLGINTTALVGYSVAGAGYVRGKSHGVRSVVGGPSNALDFGSGLLNLGNTLGVTLDFVFDNNGLGKAYSYGYTSCNITLPASLIVFKGTPVNESVLLNWTSVSEDNLNHYELQRSFDGVRFETIALLFAKNNQQNDYSYTDLQARKGNNYYRLKMVDRNTQFTYSAIVTVNFKDQSDIQVHVYPNPVKDNINIRTTGMANGTYRLALINAAGQEVMTTSLFITQPDQIKTINRTPGMVAGMYWLTIYDINTRKTGTTQVLITGD